MQNKEQHGVTMSSPQPETMYIEEEQGDEVARGHVLVKELIAYDTTEEKRRRVPDRPGMLGEVMKDRDGNVLYVEKSRRPYFCQTKEHEVIFSENNPGIRTESFGIQLLKSTAIKKLNDPENMKQFAVKKEEDK